jgi:thiol:disulfide interchange protein DsbD
MTPTERTLEADSPQSLSWLGLGGEAGGHAGPTFLQPDAAFILSVELEDPRTIVVRWQIAETYYLYRDRFGFTLRDTPGLALGEARIPPGKEKLDPYFGEVEVFYGEAWAAIPIAPGVPALSELTLDVTYQGCADLGLCYPPITKTVTVVAPPGSD